MDDVARHSHDISPTGSGERTFGKIGVARSVGGCYLTTTPYPGSQWPPPRTSLGEGRRQLVLSQAFQPHSMFARRGDTEGARCLSYARFSAFARF